MSFDHIPGIGTYNAICGSKITCAAKPQNPEATAFEHGFEGWKDFIVDLEQGSLVIGGPDPTLQKPNVKAPEVYSEGMAYGLYFSVMAGDQKTFDKLFNGLENYAVNENGLYAWRLSSKGEVLESHSATDADLYAAAAITMAYAKWQDPRYQQTAQRLLNAIWEEEILSYKGNLVVLPSDGEWARYQDGRFVYNPSYFAPSLLKLLAAADNNPKHDWDKVIDDGYKLTAEVIQHSKELNPRGMNPVPNWVLGNIFDGQFHLDTYSVTPDKEYDAIRVYLEIARDVAMTGDRRGLRIANQILGQMKDQPTPATAKMAGMNNAVTDAYYGLLYLASSEPAQRGQEFTSRLQSAYQGRSFGQAEQERKSYYFQSLMLHATALLGGYGFKPADIRAFGVTPAKGYDNYIPFRIYAREDGSVYIRNTLIYQYKVTRNGLSPYERAQASAGALRSAYLNGNLRPKYLGKVSERERGAMITNYSLPLASVELPLFEVGAQDLAGDPAETIGFRWITGLYRRTTGWLTDNVGILFGSVSYSQVFSDYRESGLAFTANSLGLKSRKNEMEIRWDRTYSHIYDNLIKSRIIDQRKEADRKLNDLASPEKVANALVDFYSLTNSARAREVAEYSRAYDDVVAVNRFITAFLDHNPLTGFSRPTSYYETLFSLANILADQDRRYRVSMVKDQLDKVEHHVRCREKRIPTGKCGDFNSSLPIQGLASSRDYLEAASKIIETIIQSDVSNFGFKARALREQGDLSFRVMERGIEVSETNRQAIVTAGQVVADYLSALEIWKDQSNLSGAVVGNWRQNPSYLAVKKRLQEPDNFYGLAEEYAKASFKPKKILLALDYGDNFEMAKISISLGKFYLFTHAREERFQEIPPFDAVRQKGLKEAETWLKFVVDDPKGNFSGHSLNVYRIEAQIRLAQAQLQLGYLEYARQNIEAANQYFSQAIKNSREAYQKVTIEINRMPPEDWANVGASMNLRNIYFNVLVGSSQLHLNLAELLKDSETSGQLTASASSHMEEALQAKNKIIFGSTKNAVYQTALWSITAEAEKLPAAKFPAQKYANILRIDPSAENSFGLIDLQLQSLALLAQHAVGAAPDLRQAEKLFTEKLPGKRIDRNLRLRLKLEDTSFRSLLESLLHQPLVPAAAKKSFTEALARQ